MALVLESSAFASGETIPTRFTCDGANVSPPLSWHGAPEGTRSFAIVCDDPDAPGGTWYHWAIYDIPAGTDSLGEAFEAGPPIKLGLSDFRRRRYDGPCPPHGHGPHRYRFTLYALPTPTLDVEDGAHCREVARAAHSHALAEARYAGIYGRGR